MRPDRFAISTALISPPASRKTRRTGLHVMKSTPASISSLSYVRFTLSGLGGDIDSSASASTKRMRETSWWCAAGSAHIRTSASEISEPTSPSKRIAGPALYQPFASSEATGPLRTSSTVSPFRAPSRIFMNTRAVATRRAPGFSASMRLKSASRMMFPPTHCSGSSTITPAFETVAFRRRTHRYETSPMNRTPSLIVEGCPGSESLFHVSLRKMWRMPSVSRSG